MSHPAIDRMREEACERSRAISDVKEAALTAIERLLAATDPFRGFRGTEEELGARESSVDVLRAAGRRSWSDDEENEDETRRALTGEESAPGEKPLPARPALIEKTDLEVGDVVEVTPTCREYADLRDTRFVVTGLQLTCEGQIDVTVAEGVERSRSVWSMPGDGFSPSELRVVARADDRRRG